MLKQLIYDTTLVINLNNLIANLTYFKGKLDPKTKIMVMVKAFSYGLGTYQVAKILEDNEVDYLGVAYVDEGVTLRQQGIQLPIMVMNTAIHELEILCQHNLEPVVYSFFMLFL